eukprot:2765709-Pyramimonas_sp.AAC.1
MPVPDARKSTIGLRTTLEKSGDGPSGLPIYPPTVGRDAPPLGSLLCATEDPRNENKADSGSVGTARSSNFGH